MTRFRLYIDEVGNSDLGSSGDPNHRFLSLTGLAFDLDVVSRDLAPRLESLKARFFGSHPDDPVILHRKELLNARRPFDALRNQSVRLAFDEELLALLREVEYVALTVAIDKLEHRQRYSTWHFDPYHYCLAVLVERFVLWLEDVDGHGDVMAESRGGGEDRRLKKSFEGVFEAGSTYVAAERFGKRLTSRQLKVKLKANNIAALQLADLVAHPSFRTMLTQRLSLPAPTGFGARIVAILEESKFRRASGGRIDGWGRKWLP